MKRILSHIFNPSPSRVEIPPEFFSEKRRRIIDKYDIPPTKLEKVFSDKELEEIKKLALENSTQTIRPGSKNFCVDWSHLKPIVLPKFKPWMPKTGRVNEQLNVTTNAFRPHTDMAVDPGQPNVIQFIVPVDAWGKDRQASIVFFKQRFLGSRLSPLFQRPEGSVERWLESRNRYIEGYEPNHKIDESLLKGPLAHVEPLLLSGLSVSEILTYEPGDLIVFGTSRVHCSGDMMFHGLFAKLFLLPRIQIGLDEPQSRPGSE